MANYVCNTDADMIRMGQRARKESTTRRGGNLVGEGPIHGGCDDFLYGAVRYIYPLFGVKKMEIREALGY